MQRIHDLDGLREELKPRLRDYLELKGLQFSSNGQQFQCPNFAEHANDDATPSAGFVSDETFHCFTCDVSGDIFSAAYLLEGKPKGGPEWVTDTVEYLAQLLDVFYEYQEMTEAEQLRYKAYECLKVTAELAHAAFLKSPDAKRYAEERKWGEAINHFQLGFCSYEKLTQILEKRGFNFEIRQAAGLISKNLLDKRILFPIKDSKGRVVGFAGRTLETEDAREELGIQKYVNSDTNTIYKKSRALFNIHNVIGTTVLIVEGYADALAFYQKGRTNVVALGGTKFTEDHVRVLVERGIKTIVLCLDNDAAGRSAEEKIMSQITLSHNLSVMVKERDEYKDASESFEHSDFLLTSKEKPLFDFYLERFEETKDKNYRDKMLRSILLERRPIDREHLCKRAAKVSDVRLEVIVDEVDHLLQQEGEVGEVDVFDLVKEKQVFQRALFDFEKKAWSRGELLGIPTSFPLFTEKMDGLQNMFYIIAGEEGTGKSAFIRALMMGCLKADPNGIFVLYFSIDDSIDKVFSRLLASETGLDINTMENPKYRIQLNTNYDDVEKQKFLDRRKAAMDNLSGLTSSFVIKDESTIKTATDMHKAIVTFKKLAGDKQLVVFVDSLHRMKPAKHYKDDNARNKAMEISDCLKTWANIYKIPIIATAELRKLNSGPTGNRRPTMDDIKEASDFKYDAEVVMLMYNDMKSYGRQPEESKLKFDYPRNSRNWFPLVELFVAKNKSSSYSQRCLYYKFIPQIARMYECTYEEQLHFHNLAFST